MKKLVFLLSFLLTFSAFAEDPKRGGEEPQATVFTPPCSPRVSKSDMFAALRDVIDKDVNMVPGSRSLKDSDNAFPAVGMVNLAGDQAGHGSGTVVGLKDDKGNVLKNKVVTSAHVLFDDNGNLEVPIESIEFLLGYDVKNEDYNFKIKKIECPERWQDQCIITLDRDVPSHITPMTPVSDPDPYINNADMFYYAGYPSWAVNERYELIGHKGQRFYTQCSNAKRWRGQGGEDVHIVGCNSAAGMSGGAFVASKKQNDGSWKDYYIGPVSAPGAKGKNNLAQTFRYNDSDSFNSVVITSENQRQFFASK